MDTWETFWRFTVTGLAVWRVSRLLLEEKGTEGTVQVPYAAAPEEMSCVRFWAGRGVDLACWISVWMSSQTAIWVTCGVAGLFLSWLGVCGASRILPRTAETESSVSPLPARRNEWRTRNG